MNRTIISIEVQDEGDKEATIIVRGERNNQIMFEEQFDYKDEEKHPLRLHLLKERFLVKFPKLGESLGILCIRKLFNDITIRSKMKVNPDYRTTDKTSVNQKKCIFKNESCKDTTCDGTQKKGCLLDQVANIKVND